MYRTNDFTSLPDDIRIGQMILPLPDNIRIGQMILPLPDDICKGQMIYKTVIRPS